MLRNLIGRDMKLALAFALIGIVQTSFGASPNDPQGSHSPIHKTGDATKKSSTKKHRKHTAIDLSDSSDSADTLESALENYEKMLAIIANNIANADTPGFKQSSAILEDSAYREETPPGITDSSGLFSANGLTIGSGCQIVGTQFDFRQGKLKHTGRELDLAIEGHGFFQIKDPGGEIQYSRAGHFALNAAGTIVIGSAKSGRLLEPEITIPQDATCIAIGSDGKVLYRTSTSTTLQQAGQIPLAKFTNPQGLHRIGENLYAESDASGTAQLDNPCTSGIGKLHQSCIEKSNVDLRHEIYEWKRIKRICRELEAILNEE